MGFDIWCTVRGYCSIETFLRAYEKDFGEKYTEKDEEFQKSLQFFRALVTPDPLAFFRKIWLDPKVGRWKIEDNELPMTERGRNEEKGAPEVELTEEQENEEDEEYERNEKYLPYISLLFLLETLDKPEITATLLKEALHDNGNMKVKGGQVVIYIASWSSYKGSKGVKVNFGRVQVKVDKWKTRIPDLEDFTHLGIS